VFHVGPMPLSGTLSLATAGIVVAFLFLRRTLMRSSHPYRVQPAFTIDNPPAWTVNR